VYDLWYDPIFSTLVSQRDDGVPREAEVDKNTSFEQFWNRNVDLKAPDKRREGTPLIEAFLRWIQLYDKKRGDEGWGTNAWDSSALPPKE